MADIDKTTDAPSSIQCEPGGTVYADDYEAIKDGVVTSTLIVTKVVRDGE